MARIKDLTGQKFGRLTIIKEVEKDKNNKSQCLCICECGNEKIIRKSDLRTGKIKSCGCIKKEILSKRQKKHGKTRTRLYRIWCNIKSRCKNKKVPCYKYYGGKGIILYEEWQNFEPFYEWAINNGYQENLTIDRIDINNNYEPKNCRWVDRKTQSRNQSTNHLITYNNETHCINEWAEIKCLTKAAIHNRIKYGWSIEKILTTPLRRKYARKQH